MNRVGLVSSEPIRERMAGIGIRYLEFSRRLPEFGVETVLLSPAAVAEAPTTPAEVRSLADASLSELLADCDLAVAQGQLANDVVLGCRQLPTVIDLYDPWLVEHFHYLESLGLDPYRNDHASWILQLSQGDFFLCSSAEQRLYYLGLLTALGRVHPEAAAADPDFDGLIAAVPFGLPEELPEYRPLLPPRRPGEIRILFGALYDWYDPWTLIEALADQSPSVRLFFVAHPDPDGTPQRLLAKVEDLCRQRSWWGDRVEVLPWVESARRFDLLRDVDVLAAPHRPSLETRLSLRTRFLDALAAGCPVVLTADGAMSRLVGEYRAGWVVPPRDRDALSAALVEAVGDEAARSRRAAGAARLATEFRWRQVLEPLARFCREPRRDTSKDRFAFRPQTQAPPDRLGFRLRRRIGRWLGEFR